MEEQGLLREIDPHAEPGAAIPPAEVAAADSREQRDGAKPGVRPQRAGSDGGRDGSAPGRAGNGRGDLRDGGGEGPAACIAAIRGNEGRPQPEVAAAAGVTEVTIRNRSKELTEKLGIKVEL